MYKNAKIEEENQNEKGEKIKGGEEEDEDEDNYQVPNDYNPLKDPKFIDMDENEFDDHVKELIEWSDNLDYDKYVRDWFQLSTSNASENFTSKPVK